MVRMSLLLPSFNGGYLECHRISVLLILFWKCRIRVVKCTGVTVSSHNVNISRPKGIRRSDGNLGSPKRRNSYGDRAKVVQYYTERLAVKLFLSRKEYSTRCRNKVILELRSLTERVEKNPFLAIDRNVYKLLCSPYMLEIAYNNIKSKFGGIASDINSEIVDKISWDVFIELSNSLKDESFQFKLSKRVDISNKTVRGKLFSTVVPFKDTIVQEAIRVILNEVFEPIFHENSHGFRPGRSCHTAFKYLQANFKSACWVFKGSIVKFCKRTDHQLLMNVIEKKILDRQFTKLIQKSLNAGYFQVHAMTTECNIAAILNSLTLNSMLNNVYFHVLDEYIVTLKEGFETDKKIRNVIAYKCIRNQIKGTKKSSNKLEFTRTYKKFRKKVVINFQDNNFKRLFYLRYANNWIIGVKGSYRDTLDIFQKISEFCKNNFKFEIDTNKANIASLEREKIVFLNIDIFRSKHVEFLKKKVSIKQRQNLPLKCHVNLDRIKKKLCSMKILKGKETCAKFLWVPLSHEQIIQSYNLVFKNYIHCYSFVGNYNRFERWLRWVIYTSAAKTLARKYNLSVQKIFDKFGSRLGSVHIERINSSYSYQKLFLSKRKH